MWPTNSLPIASVSKRCARLNSWYRHTLEGTRVARILVVDDDPSVLRFLERGLRLEGYEVSCCNSGEEAFLEARTNPPDLVILDWMLPGLQGDEVMLRLHEMLPELPVLVLSARDTTIDQERMIKTGADAVLVKPVDFRVLLGHVLRFTQSESS